MTPSDKPKPTFEDFKDNIIGTSQNLLLETGSLMPSVFIVTEGDKGMMVVLPDMPPPSVRHQAMHAFGKMVAERLGSDSIKWLAFVSEAWIVTNIENTPEGYKVIEDWMAEHETWEDFPGRTEGLTFAFWSGRIEMVDFPMIREGDDIIALGEPLSFQSSGNYLMEAILTGAGINV